MPEFFTAERPTSEDEPRYKEWLKKHPSGLVLNLRTGRDGRPTLHAAICQTLSYDLASADQSTRSPKICCEELAELSELLPKYRLGWDTVNTCSRCKGLDKDKIGATSTS